MGFVVPPSKWEAQHARQIFAAQSYQSANNGQLPDTRVWRMLEFRHNLNPSRFNFYHPNIGRMIDLQGETPAPPAEQIVRGWEGHMRGPEPVPQVINPPVNPPVIPPVIPPIIPPLNPPAGQGGTPTTPPVTPQAVPEPAAFLMFAVAILTMGLFFHRARRKPR
ncbi:hypothetical protein [Paludisphaera soli]|uniref:hypothetical protein n=1 Tax=Paludisphaera soli TaxID=2712865 RepID=UPI0013EADDE7|nr:hypothetical protein [Paludisphaera soli]